MIYIATRGGKDGENDFFRERESPTQAFIDSPDVSLFSPHMLALRTLIETHT